MFGVPHFYISSVEFDASNTHPFDRGLTEADYWHMLTGSAVDASPNRRGRAAKFQIVTSALDGRQWRVFFNFDPTTGAARPVTAFPA